MSFGAINSAKQLEAQKNSLIPAPFTFHSSLQKDRAMQDIRVSQTSLAMIGQLRSLEFLNENQCVKTWHVSDKQVTVFYGKSGLSSFVTDNNRAICVQKYDVIGIPTKILNSRDHLHLFLKDTYATLNKLNDGKYKVYVHHKGKGGNLLLTIAPALIMLIFIYTFYKKKDEEIKEKVKKLNESRSKLTNDETELNKRGNRLNDDERKLNTRKRELDNRETNLRQEIRGKVATGVQEKFSSLEGRVKSLKQEIETLTQRRNDLETKEVIPLEKLELAKESIAVGRARLEAQGMLLQAQERELQNRATMLQQAIEFIRSRDQEGRFRQLLEVASRPKIQINGNVSESIISTGETPHRLNVDRSSNYHYTDNSVYTITSTTDTSDRRSLTCNYSLDTQASITNIPDRLSLTYP